jgi:serine/threonine protein phosphatase PrpC
MIFHHRAFWLPKDIQEPKGYEDAFQVDGERGLAAVCDGVASTLFSGRWASIVAQAVVHEPPRTHDPAALEAWLKRTRETWAASVDEPSLAWHQKAKLMDGAGTTLLWVQVAAPMVADGIARPYDVWAFSIGDCCLFHVRGGQVLQTFPIQQSASFEEHPRVIRSVFKRSDTLAFEAMETQCRPGDLLVLCTDAVACWTMKQLEAGGQVDWDRYWRMSQAEWQQWVVSLRQENQIRFDDSTVVLLRVGDEPPDSTAESESELPRLLDTAEQKVRGAFQSLKGSLRKGLKDLSESKWLDGPDRR